MRDDNKKFQQEIRSYVEHFKTLQVENQELLDEIIVKNSEVEEYRYMFNGF